MATETLFDNVPDQEIIVDPTKEYFPELVGEGKKFKDPEALAKKVLHADAHIARIEQENRQLREAQNASLTMQEFLDKMEATRTSQVDPNLTNTNSQNGQNPDQNNLLTKEQVDALINAKLAEINSKTKQESNFDRVVNVLTEQFGPNYSVVLRDRAKALGVGTQFLDNLAKEAPAAFFAAIGVNPEKAPEPARTPAQPLRTNPSQVNQPKKNFAHYEKIRKENFALYNSPALHREMMQALAEMGDDFYA